MARFFDPDEMGRLERFSAQQRQRAVYRQSVTQQQVQGVSALSAAFPFMAPGVVVPAALSGVTPDDPMAQQLAEREVQRRSNSGFGWHSFGDAIKAGMGGVKKAVGAATNATQGVVRGAFMGLDAIPQGIQGGFRNKLEDGRLELHELNPITFDFSQTDAGVGLDQVVESFKEGRPFQGLDYGSGFFAGGEVEKERIRRTRAAAPLTSDNKAPSLGRWAAGSFTAPGTVPYNIVSGLVDASLVLASDPSSYFGGAVSKARKADRLFAAPEAGRIARTLGREAKPADVFVANDRGLERVAAGLVDGDTRKTVLPERVGEWLQSKRGQAVVGKLVETNDPVVLRKTFGKQIDTETLVQLADAKTSDEVYGVLGPKLGIDIREKIVTPGAMKMSVRRSLENVRWAQQMPGTHIDLLNADDAVDNLDRFLANAKVDPAKRDAQVAEMMRAGSHVQRYEILTRSIKGVTEGFIEEGLAKAGTALERRQVRESARRITSIIDDYNGELRKYFVDQIGDNVKLPGTMVDGEVKALPSPHLFGEYVNRALPLPDAREIRRETSKFAPLLDNRLARGSTTIADFVSGQVFKRLVLLRPAYTVRVIGEEQVRLAASGLTSAFVHPLSHIAAAVAPDSRAGRTLAKAGVNTDRLETDLMGGSLRESEQHLEALNRGLSDYTDPTIVRTDNWVTYDRRAPEFVEAWSDELAELYSDPIAKRAANGGLLPGDAVNGVARPGVEGIKDWFFDGAGQQFRKQLAEGKDRQWLLTREGADEYIETVLQRVNIKTGGDPNLMSVVATGKFGGEDVFQPVAVGRDGKRKHQKGTRALLGDLARRAEDQLGPERVKGQQMVHGRLESGQRALAGYDRATDVAFSYLMTRPTNLLSRSPAFRQFYYQRAEELIGFMTSDAQQAAIEAARAAGVDKDVLRRMTERAKRESGDLDLENADLLAKGHGLDKTKALLYDMHERSQFFDITRLLFPFGEAWKEVMTTWAKIGADNPTMLRRGGLVVEGGRDYDPDGDDRGFFYSDEMTGEEMFAIPLVGSIAEVFTGVPVTMEATAKGANVFSQSVYPGFGPMVQMAASKILPDDPDFDDARKLIIPFGETDTSGGVFESFFPAWVKKIMTGYAPRGEQQERALANTATEVMRYLASTGEYGNTPEEQERLASDSRKKAARLFLIRGLAQSTAPSAPMYEFAAKDKTGDTVTTFRLAEEYRKMQDDEAAGGYKTATARFIEKFGEGAFLATISKSEGGAAVTKEAMDFARENPEVARAYKDVYAYFAPTGGEFDLTAYTRQFDTGEREVRSLEDAMQLADRRIGTAVYNAMKAKVGDRPSAAQRDWLRKVKDAIREEYPGYAAAPAGLVDNELLVKQALRAASNDTLARTDAGQGLQAYILMRDKALDIARKQGLETFGRSDKTRPVREWLRAMADAISEEHPDFAPLFEEVLSREMVDDEVGVAA